jgi:trigger factor
LREAQAIPERVDRPAETGDEMQLDIVPLGADGQPEETRRVPEYVFSLGEPDNIKAFDEGLAGARSGDTREVRVAYAADHGNERLRGTTVAYRIAVKEVRQKLMPELNDAFAERVKPGETLCLKALVRDWSDAGLSVQDLMDVMDRLKEAQTQLEMLDRQIATKQAEAKGLSVGTAIVTAVKGSVTGTTSLTVQ